MNNQTSVNGGASPDPQPTIDPPSNDTSGQAPPVVALTNPSPAPASTPSQSGAPGSMVQDSPKGGHV
jgi:hypothetical protein